MSAGDWWRHGTLYQIYPLSFADSNDDGWGDLAGIMARLEYLSWLGVDAVWLSPIYPSPLADFGYDVSDYTDVAPLFGTLTDFDRLVDALHARDIRLILDFVPNHSSDRHPWFLASRSARDNPKRDWYIWRDPAPDGGAPNNWLSAFGGSAWQWDAHTGQYYLHTYLKEQPDLNWRNPQVRAAMHDVLRFWLQRGVDGFRLDAVWHVIKDEQFRDDPPNPGYSPEQPPYHRLVHLYSGDRPEVHEVLTGMREVLKEYGEERLLIGEIYLPVERLVAYYGETGGGAHLPFNFQLIQAPWKAQQLAAIIEEYEACLPAGCWPNWVLGNHDKSRIASRVGEEQARVAAMLLLTLRGTPTLYYGDELGMQNVAIPHERVRDPWELNVPGMGVGRDPARTPMHWDCSDNAGFTRAEPWLPIAEDYCATSVEVQRQLPGSLLNLYRQLLALRRAEPALHRGSYTPVLTQGDVLVYRREHADSHLLIALNLGRTPHTLILDEAPGEVLLSTRADRTGERFDGSRLGLRGDEGTVIRLGN